MGKVILSVIDENGDTWLYPFVRSEDADDAQAELVKFVENGFYLNVEVIPLEKEMTKPEIVLEWKEKLGVDQ